MNWGTRWNSPLSHRYDNNKKVSIRSVKVDFFFNGSSIMTSCTFGSFLPPLPPIFTLLSTKVYDLSSQIPLVPPSISLRHLLTTPMILTIIEGLKLWTTPVILTIVKGLFCLARYVQQVLDWLIRQRCPATSSWSWTRRRRTMKKRLTLQDSWHDIGIRWGTAVFISMVFVSL